MTKYLKSVEALIASDYGIRQRRNTATIDYNGLDNPLIVAATIESETSGNATRLSRKTVPEE